MEFVRQRRAVDSGMQVMILGLQSLSFLSFLLCCALTLLIKRMLHLVLFSFVLFETLYLVN